MAKKRNDGRVNAVIPQYIWEGVYKNFSEVPVCGEGYEGERWASASLSKITKYLALAKTPGTVSEVVAYNASLLPFLTALVSQQAGKVRILDFGGGLGFTYLPVIHSLTGSASVDYHIVENENICTLGAQVFGNNERIHFHSALTDDLRDMDIVHLGSSLHYVEQWQALIGKLSNLNPKYFLLTDLTAGDFPTYVTAQNYYGSKIPSWFFNITEVIDHMASRGFSLLFRSKHIGTYLGKQQECPQENFPNHLRIGHTCTLLFCRASR